MKKKVTLIRNGDWTAMYVDDHKVVENHILDDDEVLEALGIDFEVKELDIDNFPDNLKDIKVEEER